MLDMRLLHRLGRSLKMRLYCLYTIAVGLELHNKFVIAVLLHLELTSYVLESSAHNICSITTDWFCFYAQFGSRQLHFLFLI